MSYRTSPFIRCLHSNILTIAYSHPRREPGEGLKNAYLPSGRWQRIRTPEGDQIKIRVDDHHLHSPTPNTFVYNAYVPGQPIEHDPGECQYCEDPYDSCSELETDEARYAHPDSFEPPPNPCNGYLDVIITGEVDEEHAKAWGNYVFRGRVRAYDGLIVFYREAVSLPLPPFTSRLSSFVIPSLFVPSVHIPTRPHILNSPNRKLKLTTIHRSHPVSSPDAGYSVDIFLLVRILWGG